MRAVPLPRSMPYTSRARRSRRRVALLTAAAAFPVGAGVSCLLVFAPTLAAPILAVSLPLLITLVVLVSVAVSRARWRRALNDCAAEVERAIIDEAAEGIRDIEAYLRRASR